MLSVILVIQVIVTVFLIAVIMIQKSEGGGGLGIGGSGGGMGDFLGAKGTANLLTRITAILAATFMVLSIVLAILSSRVNDGDVSIVDTIKEQEAVVETVEVEEAVIEKVEEVAEEVTESIDEGPTTEEAPSE